VIHRRNKEGGMRKHGSGPSSVGEAVGGVVGGAEGGRSARIRLGIAAMLSSGALIACALSPSARAFEVQLSASEPLFSVGETLQFEVRSDVSDRQSTVLELGVTVVGEDGKSTALEPLSCRLSGRQPARTMTLAPSYFESSQIALGSGDRVRIAVQRSLRGESLPQDEKQQLDLPIAASAAVSVTRGGPWGVAASTEASSGHSTWWLDPVAAAGIDWIRGFDRDYPDVGPRLEAYATAGYAATGIFYWSGGDGFPDEDLPGWQAMVQADLDAAAGRVPHWEVWNEPPNFSDDKDPAHYAQIVQSAYDTVKAEDPSLAVGIAASSVNLNFLDKALAAGAAGHFDYVTLHPYETIGIAVERGFEPLYLSIAPTVRKMLRTRSPEQQNVPIVLTEIGRPIKGWEENLADLSSSEIAEREAMQANVALKAYILGIAGGLTRVHWFEPTDAEGQTFGLLRGDASGYSMRPSWTALRSLTEMLGEEPSFLGWVLLDGQLGYVFDADGEAVLATWAAPGKTATVSFAATVIAMDPLTGQSTSLQTATLTNMPMLFSALPASLIETAQSNRNLPFPWGGDFTGASMVSLSGDGETGLHIRQETPIVNAGGANALAMGENASVDFVVDPNFLSYDKVPLRITVSVRFRGDPADPAVPTPGFNLAYESVDGLKKHAIGWRTVPRDTQWHDISWDVDDPQFVGFWGYHLTLDSDSTWYSQYDLRSMSVARR